MRRKDRPLVLYFSLSDCFVVITLCESVRDNVYVLCCIRYIIIVLVEKELYGVTWTSA